MITIISIGTKEPDYLKGIAFARTTGEIRSADPDEMPDLELEQAAITSAMKESFERNAREPKFQVKDFARSSITLFQGDEPEEAVEDEKATMTLTKDGLRNRVCLSITDQNRNNVCEIFIDNEEISRACHAQKALSKDKAESLKQQVYNEDLPLIELIGSKAGFDIIGDRDELRGMSNYIYQAVLGQQLAAILEREWQPKPSHRFQ